MSTYILLRKRNLSRQIAVPQGKEKGSQLLANMCSKAVNQSIGRAIRHSQDYATIILIDHRFARTNQQALLPNWILKRFQVCEQFGQAVGSVAKFFASKKVNP